jgi:hypothetical protein
MTASMFDLRPAAVAALLFMAPCVARAATQEVQVPFDAVPTVVQEALTNYAGGLTDVARASAFRGTLSGRIVYTGKVTDIDGTTRIIDVDADGNLVQFRQLPRTRSILPPYVRGR